MPKSLYNCDREIIFKKCRSTTLFLPFSTSLKQSECTANSCVSGIGISFSHNGYIFGHLFWYLQNLPHLWKIINCWRCCPHISKENLICSCKNGAILNFVSSGCVDSRSFVLSRLDVTSSRVPFRTLVHAYLFVQVHVVLNIYKRNNSNLTIESRICHYNVCMTWWNNTHLGLDTTVSMFIFVLVVACQGDIIAQYGGAVLAITWEHTYYS